MNITVTSLSLSPISCSLGLLQPGASLTVAMPPEEMYKVATELNSLETKGLVSVSVATESGLEPRVDTSNTLYAKLLFGGGSDGKCAFDGTATFTSFASLAGSTYTLTRDVFLGDGSSIASGVTVYTAGYRLFCNGQLTNNGTIHNDGKDASGATGGTASASGSLGIGTAGGNGHSSTAGNGANGTAQSNGLYDVSAAGGTGGGDGTHTGGTSSYAAAAAGNGGSHWLMPMLTGFLQGPSSGGNQGITLPIGGGAGGGGGGNDGANGTGGGGGGGGGVMTLHVYSLVNNGAIHANGGAGAAATGTSGNAGGGGGGYIINLYRKLSGAGTMTVSGGAGGAKFGSTGTAGAAGSAGDVNQFQV